ncbi:hypothetical protein D3C85_1399240 [compost metagenome]
MSLLMCEALDLTLSVNVSAANQLVHQVPSSTWIRSQVGRSCTWRVSRCNFARYAGEQTGKTAGLIMVRNTPACSPGKP